MTDREKLEKIKSLADKMYTSMQNLTSDTTPIRKAMDEYKRFIVHEYHNEEPVSEDTPFEPIGIPANAVELANIPNKKEPTIPDIVDEHFWEMLGEEPVSEDLEEAAIQFATDTETGKVDVVKQSSFFWGAIYHKQQMMKEAFDFTKEHNIACVLASECLRNHGWFSRERVFNDLFRHLSCVDKLFEGKFSGKTKVIVIKED